MNGAWWTDPSELDADQRKVIALSPGNDHLVVGPPGSGKTNLLLLRATYLYKMGVANIAILTFGRVLREFLAAGATYYPFAHDKIQTYVRWGAQLLRANGTIFEESTNFEEARAQLYTALSTIAARQKLENVYDVILIDEVQDYSVDEITLIKQFGERLFAVGDNNQQISDHHGALAQLESLGVTKTPLTSHYRNGLKICRVADGIKNLIDHRDGLEATSNYDEARFPSRVEAIGDLSLEDQVTAAVPRIQTQLLAYPGEMIGIFCPRLEDLDTARAVFEESELSGEIHVQRSGAY